MTLGNEIDSRNIGVPLKEGDLLGDIVVIAEVYRDGRPQLVVVTDENMNWIKEDGMISRALDKIRYEIS